MRLLLLALATFTVHAAHAAAGGQPVRVSHSGYVLNATDQPLEGTADLVFRVHATASGGAPEWQGACADVPVRAGYFAVVLGSTDCVGVTTGGLDATLDTADLPVGEARWVEVEVDGEVLLPRLQINALPSAAVAARAFDADALQGRVPGTAAGNVVVLDAQGRLPAVGGSQLTGLDAAQIATGTLAAGRLPASVAQLDRDVTFSGAVNAARFAGEGTGLTKLDASQLLSGTVAFGRLPAAIARTDGAATFAGGVSATSFTGSGAGLTAESLPLAALAKGACAPGQLIRRKADDTGWECFTQASVGGAAALTFTNVTGAAVNTLIESAPVTISGFTGSLAAICSGCEVRRGTGAYATVLSVTSGDALTLRVRSSTVTNASVVAALSVGATVSAPWSVTTIAVQNPDCYSKPVHTTAGSMNELLASMPTGTWICVKSGGSAALGFKLTSSLASMGGVDLDLQGYFDTSLMRWTTDGGVTWTTPTVRGYWFDESGTDDYMFLAAGEVNSACRGGASCTGITWRYDTAACSFVGHLAYSGTGYGCNGQSGSIYTANW